MSAAIWGGGIRAVLARRGPRHPGIAATTGTATVLDDDAGTPVISLSGGSVVEDAASIRYINFDITLSEPSAGTVQVSFRTIAGTARTGIDYQEDFRHRHLRRRPDLAHHPDPRLGRHRPRAQRDAVARALQSDQRRQARGRGRHPSGRRRHHRG